MKVFLLALEIYPKDTRWHDGVVVGIWNYYDVFLSVNKAVAAGKKAMLKKLKEIKKLAFKDCSLNELAEDELSYTFCVYEFDPNDKRKRDTWQFGGSKNFGSSKKWDEFTWWRFKYNGELEKCCKWRDLGYMHLPGDEKEDAGTKFKVGDFVTITGTFGILDQNDNTRNSVMTLGENMDDTQVLTSHKGNYSDVFVVMGVPGKKNESKIPDEWENMYTVVFIDDKFLYDHSHPHELQIRPFEGEIPEDHPLWLLRKLAKDEIKLSDELWEDIFMRRVQFDYKLSKSWKDIPELN